MYSFRILNAKQLKPLLQMHEVIDSVEEAYKLYSNGQAGLFPVIIHEFEVGMNDMDIKSGHLSGAGIHGLKMLGWCRDNPEKGFPALSGLIVLMGIEHQQPVGIIDAAPITFLRTGAAGAIGAKTFARKCSKKAIIVGSGTQGRAQLLGLSIAVPTLEEVHFFDHYPEAAQKLVSDQQANYPNIALYDHHLSDLENTLKQADIVVTCTTSRKHFIHKSWVKPGTHINAIGTDAPGKQELEPSLVASSKVFADSISQVITKGECQWAIAENMLKKENITEIGQVLNGIGRGRSNDDEITIFDSTGMALQDLITAKLVLDKAAIINTGTIVSMED